MYYLYLLLCVQCSTPDAGQKTCPKHVEFYSKNKSEKLVHLVGFIIGMCLRNLLPPDLVYLQILEKETDSFSEISVTIHKLT
jgi:hypothetical protein